MEGCAKEDAVLIQGQTCATEHVGRAVWDASVFHLVLLVIGSSVGLATLTWPPMPTRPSVLRPKYHVLLCISRHISLKLSSYVLSYDVMKKLRGLGVFLSFYYKFNKGNLGFMDVMRRRRKKRDTERSSIRNMLRVGLIRPFSLV